MIPHCLIGSGDIRFQIEQTHGHEGKALIDIIVQFSGNSGAFLLMSPDQPATHIGKSLLVSLALFCHGRKNHEGNSSEQQE
jgi:hypothetical protein